jgi:hypothetical protein
MMIAMLVALSLTRILKRRSKHGNKDCMRSRAGIEGLISHLKHDHRMLRNYLKGTAGDKINTLLAASAYNMMKWMRMKREEILFFVFRWLYQAKFFALLNIQSSGSIKKVN